MTAVQLKFVKVRGIDLAYYERGKPSAARPTLLFVHATGFHARVYDRIIEAFDGYHVLALDQRGHGRSESVAIEHWRSMGEDLAAFVETLNLTSLIGVGHSMGAHAMVDAASISGAFARLILLDPTIGDPQSYDTPMPGPTTETGMHPAAKRKRHFASPEQMMSRLGSKGGYALFEPRILADYCHYGLVPDVGGGFTLACRPEVEASVYAAARSNPGVFDSVRDIDIPVTIMRAKAPPEDRSKMDFSSSPTWPGLVKLFRHGREIHLPDCSHFIPMQMPQRVIDVLQEEIAQWQRA